MYNKMFFCYLTMKHFFLKIDEFQNQHTGKLKRCNQAEIAIIFTLTQKIQILTNHI